MPPSLRYLADCHHTGTGLYLPAVIGGSVGTAYLLLNILIF